MDSSAGDDWFMAGHSKLMEPFMKVSHKSTGRIGSRQQLAENAWLVSLGCSGGPQWSCGVQLHITQRWFEGKPLF